MTKDEALELFNKIRRNQAARSACPRHSVEQADQRGRTMFVCRVCGAEFDWNYLDGYLSGIRAAGGSTADVWPEA